MRLPTALSPMQATVAGTRWVMSTPNGQAGYFYNVWRNGGPEWERVMVKAEDCPRISREFLESELRAMGPERYRQEYCCEFVKGDGYLFSTEQIDAIYEEDGGNGAVPLVRSHRDIVIGLDLGKLRDFTALAVLERYQVKTGFDAAYRCDVYKQMVAVRHLERIRLGTSYVDVTARVRRLASQYSTLGKCSLVVDAVGVGEPVVDLLRNEKMDCAIVPVKTHGGEESSKVHGVHRVAKRDMMASLELMVAEDRLRIPAGMEYGAELRDELLAMGRNLSAVSGHDDLVMAMALGCWRLRTRRKIGERGDGPVV